MPNFKKITAPTLDNNSRSASGGKQTNQISIFQKLENLQQILVMFLLISFVNSLLNLSCFLIGGSGVVLFFNQSFFPYLSPPPTVPTPQGQRTLCPQGQSLRTLLCPQGHFCPQGVGTLLFLRTFLSLRTLFTFVPRDTLSLGTLW